MKQDRLAQCIGDVDGKYVQEAEQYKKKSRSSFIKWGAAAACLCLLLVVAAARAIVPNAPAALDEVPNAGHALLVPAIELPEDGDEEIQMSMIALIVYKGHVYTQTSWYDGEEGERVERLVAERLGYAKGGINEWSKQGDYAVEFASTVVGDVYALEGYSPAFRICIKGYDEDENGNKTPNVQFFENLNGIGITTGRDLFGDRLGMLEKWEYIEYQEHSNWDNGAPDYVFHRLQSVSGEEIDAFMEALYAGEFEYVYESDPDFYFNSRQTHLFIHMDDDTVVELRLFEGGYVGYQHMGWYFVKMPGEAFDLLFEACS
ncbi:hypothetical protein LJC27_05335 [Christensenellaceae bacterium OttesenSCG-928-M15]|nr:hypothetical protein [Christensenellaceae bacterium OttesenSCG-928-M15]